MVAMNQIIELSERIGRKYDPERIVLFGSHAYGSPREDSDVDLLVVMRFEGSAFRKSLEILNWLDPPFYIDVLVRDPEDARKRYREGDPLIREALDRGRVLHERDCS